MPGENITASLGSSSLPSFYALLLLCGLAFVNFSSFDAGIYTSLAESLLKGQLHLTSQPRTGWMDMAFFDSRYYCPFGILPAIVAMPFVWFGYYHQGSLNAVMSVAVFYLCYRLGEKSRFSKSDSLWLALAFTFGTSFVDAAFFSWHIAHTIAVFFLFLAIHEYLDTRRPWLIGAFIGLAAASRPMTALWILCFAANFLLNETTTRTLLACAVFALFAVAIGSYNYVRFGDPLEAGYTYQRITEDMPHALWNVRGNIPGPAFDLGNIPENLKTFLWGLPNMEAVGVSVILMSPFLIYLFVGERWERIDSLIAINTLVIIVVLLAFRSTGFRQAGYRFSLDFMPFVFWLLMRSRDRLTVGFKALIFIATIIDLALVTYFVAFRF